MAIGLILGTVAEEGHGGAFGELLQESQREFLSVVLDGRIATIDASGFTHFIAIAATELGPTDRARQNLSQ